MLAIGDVVIGTRLIQHDLDASPICAPRGAIAGKAVLEVDPQISQELLAAARAFISEDLAAAVTPQERARFRIGAPKILAGLIGSGDKFFASRTEIAQLRERLPEVLCVEMEGAAVAQVCEEYGVRFGVLRTISDAADENSVHDFPGFLREVAGQYLSGNPAALPPGAGADKLLNRPAGSRLPAGRVAFIHARLTWLALA